jgi:phage tail sheath protein FI
MRTIESAGVEINEIDLTANTELPNGTTSLVVGYAKQGPSDELLNVTSPEELEQIYGLPENAAERYMYNTAKQVLNANGNLLVTRLPYGSGDGDGYTTKYSALVYPYIPVDVTDSCTTYSSYMSSVTASAEIYSMVPTAASRIVTSEVFAITDTTNATCATVAASSQALVATVSFVDTVCGAIDVVFNFNTDGSVVSAAADAGLATYPTLSAGSWTSYLTEATLTTDQIIVGEIAPVGVFSVTLSGSSTAGTFVSATFDTSVISKNLTGAVPGVAADASHYFLGQPIHISIDEDTYFSWLQGGINWKSTIDAGVSALVDTTDTNDAALLANIGYGAMVVVNEAKTVVTDQFEGYYIALADNSKMDKGSNFDSIANIKTFNQYSDESEWIALNPTSLAFSLTGSYFEHSGSVSEIVESVPDFDFSNTGAGGFGDSIVLTLFKVRPSIYNQDTRVLDKVLYESYIGSLDSTRQIQNQNGGAPANFFIEDVVNKNSSSLKVFVNPYISKFSGQWFDSQTQEPTKAVRIVCGERDVIGSDSTDVIGTSLAEPHATAKVIFDAINTGFCAPADSMYGVGEAIPCNALLEKSIGNLPRKLEKALRLAENYELLRLDLVPEGGLGTIWTGMNLDMSNYAAGTTSRSQGRTRELFDDTVYVDGILNAHTFDADSDGLLSQTNGSASEASDLYESVATIFNQFSQFTRKDCLYIADPLRYVFVQGNGDVKVMDNKKLNFSQHIFWPLKNLFGGLNSSYSCTYANWFKVLDTVSDRFTWVPPSGFAANLMVKTDTNFFPWYATAGLTRGIMTGVLDIGINPTQKQRDLLYKNGINPTVYWPGDGYVIWGQKTLQRKPSAFDRINVRRLFLWCEKAVLQVSRYFVFEQNTAFTRNRLKAAIEPILGFAKSNEGIYDYMIVCDDRNNTPDVIDRNEMVVDIYIKPVRVAEFILINFIATRTGQRFDELI